jgi:hypothetical protein
MDEWKELCEEFAVSSPSVPHRQHRDLYKPCPLLKKIKEEGREGGREGGGAAAEGGNGKGKGRKSS